MNDFSLLMSVYKGEKAEYLTACFDSIQRQTLQPTEIVLVEDGPLTPALYQAIDAEQLRFKKLKRVPLAENQGLGAALNKGLSHCTYDIIARMDTDDICLPERFETQVAYLEEHPDVDVLGAWISEFDNDTQQVVAVRSLPEHHDEIYRFGKKRNPANHPTVMFRKQAVIQAGGYQPFPLFEDYYLWARMLNSGFRFHNLPQSLLRFRCSQETFGRRGGRTYARHEIQLFRELHRIGYISRYDMTRNILQRFVVRLLPNSLRRLIYKYLLRSIP